MLQNAYLVAKIGADTAENEQHFAEILPTDALWRLSHNNVYHGRRPPVTPPRAGLQGDAPAYVGSPTQLSNYLTWKGSFSAVSKPKFASKYALESSRRDLQNALLCTVLHRFGIESQKPGKPWGEKNLAQPQENWPFSKLNFLFENR